VTATALLIIDVQNGLAGNPAQPPNGGDAFLARLNSLVHRAREADVPVVFVQHDGGAGHPLEKPNPGWEIHPSTGFRRGDLVVEKQYCDAFQDTGLQDLLASLGAKDLVLAGMMTEYCVDTTCRRAFSQGYRVTLVSDAHSTFSRDDLSAEQIIAHHNSILGSNFATLRSSDAVDFQSSKALA
jgi:aminoglycoside 6'-N-acetyltransferase